MTTTLSKVRNLAEESLKPELLLQMHDLMLKARLLEERLIRMQKQGDGYFWIGGPGEEAFNVPLGLLTKKGEGPDYDYLHLHYRASGTMLALGADPVDALRQMKSTASDPYSGGRNFASHYSARKWNVVPVSSPIEVQYSMAPGTALAQRRHGGTGITIVTGGDAGTAEGDFATCLIWSSRKGSELPMLIIVTNNQYGISTPYDGQHGEKRIADRGAAFGIRTLTIDGNDPETCYRAISRAMDYVRRERKPFLLEAMVSRLYGHSSSSGANYIEGEADGLKLFEDKLISRQLLTKDAAETMRTKFTEELLEASKRVREEAPPAAETVWDHVFAERSVVGGSNKGAR